MKITLCIFFVLIFMVTFSTEKADSSKAKLKADAVISLNSNGIASIPAFSLEKPAVIASITLAKNRFSYEPQLAYSLDFKPWFIDNWLRYKIIRKPTFEFRTGLNLSSFFSEYKLPDESILQGQRYFAIELNAVYKVTAHCSFTFAYWNDRGQDKGTLIGHFFNLSGERSGISIGKSALLSAAIQLFYIDYDGKNDGLFVSPKSSFSVRKVPVTVFFQAIQALESNISPFPGFRWNLGISYSL